MHLSKAPITEALLQIRVQPRDDFGSDELLQAKGRLEAKFPKHKEMRNRKASFHFGTDGSRQELEDLGLDALILLTSDELDICQLRRDSLTVNRLKPYESWATLFPQTMELWNVYRAIASPSVVTRLSVRYLNRLLCPPGMKSFAEVLTAGPSVPPGVPPYVSTFLTRMAIHDPERGLAGNIGQALETADGQAHAILLDIEAFVETDLAPTSEEIPKLFESLRSYKNQIFFSSLQERVIEELK